MSLWAMQDFIQAVLKADDWVGIVKIKKLKALRMTFLEKKCCIFIFNPLCKLILSCYLVKPLNKLHNCLSSIDRDVTDYSSIVILCSHISH